MRYNFFMLDMKNNDSKFLPETLEFKGVWRSYQKAFLDDISIHLSDKLLLPCYGLNYIPLQIHILKPNPQCDHIWRQGH